MIRWLLGGTGGQYAGGADSWKVEWRAVKGVTFNPSTQLQPQLMPASGGVYLCGVKPHLEPEKKKEMNNAKVPGPSTTF